MKNVLATFLLAAAGCGGGSEGPIACKADSLEPNGERAGAQRVGKGATSGLTACAAEEDWYVVGLAAGDTLKVNVDFQGAPESLRVTIHESTQGAAIARAVAGGGGLEASLQPGAAGDYFVRVVAGQADLPYDLGIDLLPSMVQCAAGTHAQNGKCVADGCDDLGLEANDSVADARPLVPGTYKKLKICDAADRDFYAITPPPGGGVVTASLGSNPFDGNLDVYVTDGTMVSGKLKVLAAGATDAAEDWVLNVPVADNTPVYLLVAGARGATGDYDLDVRVDPLDPKRDCLTGCEALVPMDGAVDPADPVAIAAGYYIGTSEEYAWARRDLAMWFQWAFGQVVKKWPGTPPVYLSDISQENGKTPGTDVRQPRHPTTTHVNGRDADIAYFSTLGDNDYRIICGDGTDNNWNGRPGMYNDGYFCTTKKNVVDMPKQVYFIAMLMAHPGFRVLGIDETLPDPMYDQATAMVTSGELPPWVMHRFDYGLGYGDSGGWAFHHHHIHLSLFDR